MEGGVIRGHEVSVAAHDQKRKIQMEFGKDMPHRSEKLIYDRDEAGVEKCPCAPAEYIPVGKQIVPQYDRYIGDSPDNVSGLLFMLSVILPCEKLHNAHAVTAFYKFVHISAKCFPVRLRGVVKSRCEMALQKIDVF